MIKKRGGYHTSGPRFREDLQESFDSVWEANIARYFQWLLEQQCIIGWQRERQMLLMPSLTGEIRKNHHFALDFVLYLPFSGHVHYLYRPEFAPFFRALADQDLRHHVGVLPILIEVKGRLDQGGFLPQITEDQLHSLVLHGDADSAIKLRRLQKTKAYQDRIIFILGAAEYAQIQRDYAARINGWESR